MRHLKKVSVKKIIILLGFTILCSFSKTSEKENLILKTWILTKVEPGECFTRIYKDTTAFGNNAGFTFLKNGKLVACLPDNGSCPVGDKLKLKVVNGKWSKESDSIYVLNYPIYPKAERIRISILTKNQLVLKRTFCK
mgnify:FL=1